MMDIRRGKCPVVCRLVLLLPHCILLRGKMWSRGCRHHWGHGTNLREIGGRSVGGIHLEIGRRVKVDLIHLVHHHVGIGIVGDGHTHRFRDQIGTAVTSQWVGHWWHCARVLLPGHNEVLLPLALVRAHEFRD